MVQTVVADATYILGRTEAEAQRLMLQARLYDRLTRRLFTEAGITPGMRVLDVGCGAGDVTFAAADLVGPSGRVIGVDVDPAVLDLARARAQMAQRANVTFIAGDCRTADLPDDFDAAVGRLVLMYTGDVSDALRAIVARVRPGGVVAFAEAEFSSALGYMRAVPPGLNASLWEWAAQAFASAGAHTAMAGPLHRAFVAAGLGAPRMELYAPLGGGESWDGYAWAGASFRSLLPVLERAGIVTAEALAVETLAARTRAEVDETGFPFMVMPLVTAWACKPPAA